MSENQNTHFMLNNFSENRAVCEMMRGKKNMVEPNRPQYNTAQKICALHAGQLRLQTHTQRR